MRSENGTGSIANEPGSEMPAGGAAQILQIYCDSVNPGKEAAYRAVEEDAARVSARLRFPNPHLALESLTGPKEVWWLNAFASEESRQQITKQYEANLELVAGLTDITRRRESLVGPPIDLLARFRPDLGRGRPWNPAGARFYVVSVTKEPIATAASVFEAPDGALHSFSPAPDQAEAESMAGKRTGDPRVFAVRPYWGMPAREWVAADPEFWRASPAAGRQ
jgi:hypothetical protein